MDDFWWIITTREKEICEMGFLMQLMENLKL
jgi:hypothetical protein